MQLTIIYLGLTIIKVQFIKYIFITLYAYLVVNVTNDKLTSKTFFGIVFGVPLATALGIEAASFLIFPGLCPEKVQKNIADSPTFFSPARF